MNYRLTILTILATCVAMPAGGRVGSTTVEELTVLAEYITIGRVSEVREVEGVRVAVLKPSKILKGGPARVFYFLAEGTWTCDISTAEPGEEILLFLLSYRFDPKPEPPGNLKPGDRRRGFKEPAGFAAAIQSLSGATPFLEVAWAGRGRMPIREVDGRQYATLWTGDVRLPEGISTIDGPQSQRSFIRSVELDLIVRMIDQGLED